MANVINFPAVLEGSAGNGLFSRISTAISNYSTYRRTIAELRSLTTRELQDLGISRYSINQIAYEAVYGA